MKTETWKTAEVAFLATLMVIIGVFALSVWKVSAFNHVQHYETISGAELFSSENSQPQGVSVKIIPRSSTWTKLFDIRHEGLTEHNYRAYIYDFNVSNNTRDEVSNFSYKLTFDRDVFLLSAWNGAVEVHQKIAGGEIVEIIPDLREFVSGDYSLRTVTFDGETLIYMKAGESVVYIPSSSRNAMEVPIRPHEGTMPGFIMYTEIGKSIEGSSLELEYTFHKPLNREPLFWVAVSGLSVWFVALVIFVITSAQIKKYKERYDRDNKIINESIETFTGFIDAKDSYTNGHSKRVAVYTRQIAAELGYEGEELDHIYYIALLHDCGKIGVPDKILGKPHRLNDEEYEIIKRHTICGSEILSSFKSLASAGEGALYHHERYDGNGYPNGTAGEDIPFIARIICVADAFDAMNTNRVYRNKLTKESIMNEIEKNKGQQFDPEIADVMLRLLRENKIDMDIVREQVAE